MCSFILKWKIYWHMGKNAKNSGKEDETFEKVFKK
jgi:hypothetical protein